MVEAATQVDSGNVEQADSGQVDSGVPAGGQVSSEPVAGNEPTAFELPEQFKDHKLFSDIDSADKLNGRLDWLHELRGKKGIPQDDTVESWTGFIDGLGERKGSFQEAIQQVFADSLQPKATAPESYEFKDIEGYNDDGATDSFFSEMFKKHNISQDMANSIRQDTIENFLEYDKQHKSQLNDQFISMAKEEWGDKWESEIAEATAEFKKIYTDEQRAMIEDIPNEVLIPMLKYVKNNQAENANFNGAVGVNGGANRINDDDLKAKYKELSAEKHKGGRFLKEFNDFQNANREQLAKAFKI